MLSSWGISRILICNDKAWRNFWKDSGLSRILIVEITVQFCHDFVELSTYSVTLFLSAFSASSTHFNSLQNLEMQPFSLLKTLVTLPPHKPQASLKTLKEFTHCQRTQSIKSSTKCLTFYRQVVSKTANIISQMTINFVHFQFSNLLFALLSWHWSVHTATNLNSFNVELKKERKKTKNFLSLQSEMLRRRRRKEIEISDLSETFKHERNGKINIY